MERTKVFEWVKDGNLNALEDYLEDLADENIIFDYNERDYMNRTILHWSCFLGQLEMTQFLLNKFKMNIHDRDWEGNTPLDLAIIRGYSHHMNWKHQLYIVQFLISKGARFHHHVDGKNSPLHWACYMGNKWMIYFILENDYKLIYKQNELGVYPLDYLFYSNKHHAYQIHTQEIFEHVMKKYLETVNFKNHDHDKGVAFFSQRMVSDPWLAEDEPQLQHNPKQYKKTYEKGSFLWESKKSEKKDRFELIKPLDLIVHTPGMAKTETQQLYLSQNRQDISEFDNEINVISMRNVQEFEVHQNHRRKRVPIVQNGPINTFVIKRHHTFRSSHIEIFETRLLYWSAYLNLKDLCIALMERKNSPFQITFKGQNSIHVAAHRGNFEVLQLFLKSVYTYDEFDLNLRQNKSFASFNKLHNINILTQQQPSTALHLAVESENYHCVKLLVESGASIEIVNYRNLTPFEMTYNHKMLKFYHEHFKDIADADEKSFIDRGFLYVIQTKGKIELDDDIVLVQLQNIREKFKQEGMDFGFTIFFRPNLQLSSDKHNNNDVYKPPFFYYIIQMKHDTIYKLADKFNLQCYNLKRKIICEFTYNKHEEFEFPSDLQVQQLLINAFNEEFDIEKFVMEKQIICHFPIENQKKIKQMQQFWNTDEKNIIKDSIRRNTDQGALKPLHSLALYFGPVIAYHLSFIVQLVGWLVFPSIIGFVLGFYIVYEKSFDNKFIPLYALFMAVWATLFMESWKRRESELTYCWDMYKFKQVEPTRVMYTGPYILSPITHTVEEFDPFTTFQRRLLVDGPIIILGLCLALTSFFAFLTLQTNPMIANNSTLKIIVSSLNAVVMVILSTIYKMIVTKEVEWENHSLESEMLNSYIIKVFLFEFVNSYIMLIYQAVFVKNPSELSIQVGSIVITRGIVDNILSNVLPCFINKAQQKLKEREFSEMKTLIKRRKYSSSPPKNISPQISQLSNNRMEMEPPLQSSHNIKSSEQNYYFNKFCDQNWASEILNENEAFDMLKFIELNVIRQNQKLLIDEYTSIAIQFGYVTMFATAFPAAPLIFMINTYINLKLSLYNYQHTMRRERSMAADSIGIWLSIFSIMNYAATFMNCIVIGTTNVGQLNNLVGNGEILRNIFILISVEHIILFVKFIISSVIDDIPKWVKDQLETVQYEESRLLKI